MRYSSKRFQMLQQQYMVLNCSSIWCIKINNNIKEILTLKKILYLFRVRTSLSSEITYFSPNNSVQSNCQIFQLRKQVEIWKYYMFFPDFIVPGLKKTSSGLTLGPQNLIICPCKALIDSGLKIRPFIVCSTDH